MRGGRRRRTGSRRGDNLLLSSSLRWCFFVLGISALVVVGRNGNGRLSGPAAGCFAFVAVVTHHPRNDARISSPSSSRRHATPFVVVPPQQQQRGRRRRQRDLDTTSTTTSAAAAAGDGGGELDIPSMVEEAAAATSDDEAVNTDDAAAQVVPGVPEIMNNREEIIPEDEGAVTREEQQQRQQEIDETHMRSAIQMAQSIGGERGASSPYPNPVVGAVLVAADGVRVLGKGRADYDTEAVRACLTDAGLEITPLTTAWYISVPQSSTSMSSSMLASSPSMPSSSSWPSKQLRHDLSGSTLYVTLEPSHLSSGTAAPPVTQLILQAGIPRVVIGCAHPVPERASKGAAALHAAGTIQVSFLGGSALEEECRSIIRTYAELANSKLQRMARLHYQQFQRPLGFLHCSVVDADNVQAFARHGNAFGTDFGGAKNLGKRDFGSYEIAPPPEAIWASDDDDDDEEEFDENTELDDFFMQDVDFEDEDYQGYGDMYDYDDGTGSNNPMMPWYAQVDAVVATLPRPGNGPSDDDSVTARLNGLKWLATHGQGLPAGVERILVMDATDLRELPLTNDNEHWNSPDATPKQIRKSGGRPAVDVEAFWRGEGRKPTRLLLRRGVHAAAAAAAKAAAVAAKAAADAAQAAAEALEMGRAESAAETAMECQTAASQHQAYVQKELHAAQELKRQLQEKYGVVVETLEGGEPVDVMRHLGKRNGYRTVVWRAGCWGNRGVRAILEGAFQWVSAHLAVDAVGGRFWQLMLAENAVQAACGPEAKVKIFAEQEDVSLEYCDDANADTDCVLTVNGRPVRHIRLDCRVALVDDDRPREFKILPTQKMDQKMLYQEAPWFL